MTDESVPVYYTCIMCQAFSPSHVCIVTPERLGLCGAVSWLDAKATNELDPQGPCQVVPKDRCIDERTWAATRTWTRPSLKYSHGALEHVTLYSPVPGSHDLLRLLRVHLRRGACHHGRGHHLP